MARLLRRGTRLREQGQHASARLSRWRGIWALAGLLVTITLYRIGEYDTGNWVLLAFVAGFLAVAAYHNRLEHQIHRIGLWLALKQTHLARLHLDWPSLPADKPVEQDAPLYARDLDLRGPRSLLHLLDTTISTHGRGRLAAWLLDSPPSEDVWRRRQQLVRELARRPLFRDRLTIEAQRTGQAELDGHRLTAVLQHDLPLPSLHLLLPVQAVLALTTLTLGLAALVNWLPGYWMFSFALYVMILFHTDQGEELLEHAIGLHHAVDQLQAVLRELERRAQPPGTALALACEPLSRAEIAPSRALHGLARVFHAISVKAHPLVHLLLNALGPWDLFFLSRLRIHQRTLATLLPVWLDRLAEVEAASALATFAALHPSYTWPEPTPAAGVAGTHLGHPLIPASQRVTNDVTLSGLGTVHLVTGSNMSGKSTFLRTIGINLCLAQAGAPVCASRFTWSWCRLACCIRVDDSLDAGLSFFYAEVKRLKAILAATQERSGLPVLFLIDEIFKGTNNRERLIGSRAYIGALANGHGYGLVTTHDLELTDLERSIPGLRNSHFQETVDAGTLTFDYTLRPGPCPTTNALRIMEMEGLPIRTSDR